MENQANLIINLVINPKVQQLTENGLILTMQANDFYLKNKPSKSTAELLLNEISPLKIEDYFFKTKKQNFILILIYILSDSPYSSRSEHNNEYLSSFHKLPNNSPFFIDANKPHDSIYTELCIIINKLEYLYRYQEFFLDKQDFVLTIANDLRNFTSIHDFSYIQNIVHYYIALSLYLQNDLEKASQFCIELVINLDNQDRNQNFYMLSDNVKGYLKVRNMLLMVAIDQRRSPRDEKQNVLAVYNSYKFQDHPVFMLRVSMHLADLYYKEADYDSLFKVLRAQFNFLGYKAISGNNKIPNFLETKILVILRLLNCHVLFGLHRKKDNPEELCNNSIESVPYSSVKLLGMLDQYYNLLEKGEDFYRPGNNYYQDSEIRSSLLSYLNLYHCFYRRIIDRGLSNTNALDSILRANPKLLASCSTDVLVNVFLLKPNEPDLNKFFESKLNSYLAEQEQSINSLIIFNVKISQLLQALVSDPSVNKQREYSDRIKLIASKALKGHLNHKTLGYPYYIDTVKNIYFSLAFTHYFNNHLEKSLGVLDEYDKYSEGLNQAYLQMLDTSKMLKLRADVKFNQGEYKASLNIYLKVLSSEFVENIEVLYFNCALCLLNLGDIPKAKEYVALSCKSYNEIKSKKFDDVENQREAENIRLWLSYY